MSELASRECIPCAGGVPPLGAREQERYLSELAAGWRIVNGHHLEKEFRLGNFREGLALVNQVGEIAEAAGHHPDIELSYERVRLSIWTHKIDGLSEADFVLAAKIDRLGR